MNKKNEIKLFKYLLYTLFCIVFLTTPSTLLAMSQSSTTITSTFPVLNKAAVFRTVITPGSTDYNFTGMSFESSGQFQFDGESYKSVSVYKDNDTVGEFNETQDSLLATISNPNGSFSLAFSETISSGNASSFSYFVVVELNDSITLGNTSTFTLKQMTSSEPDTISDAATTTLTATGLEFSKNSVNNSITPDFIFPGQTTALIYFTATPNGENIKDLTLTIEDNFNQFSSVSNTGVTQVDLYRSKFADNQLEQFVTFNAEDIWSQKLQTLTNFSNTNTITFDTITNASNSSTINDGDKEGYWLVYTLGENTPLSTNSKIDITITSFKGTGDTSILPINNVTLNISTEVPIAGVTIEEVTDQTTDDNYGPYSFAPILSFKVRSHLTQTIINKINIQNSGSIPFFTDPLPTNGTGENITKVELYEDDGNASFSITADKLIGSLDCHQDSSNQFNNASIPLTLEVTTFNTQTYPLNNEKLLFVVYHFGSSIPDSGNPSGNFVSASIGNIYVTGNVSFFSLINEVGFRASNVSDSAPLSSSPTASITISDTTLAISSVNIISPTNCYEGEKKVPMLYLEIESETLLETGIVTIYNSQGNFRGQTDGVTRVSLYRDDNGNATIDESDTFLSSVSDFENDAYNAILTNVTLIQGKNKLLISYDIGQETQATAFSAKLADIKAADGTAILGGLLPIPQTPASTTAISKLINGIILEELNFTTSTTTFNIQLQISNSSGQSIDVTNLKPKIYLNDISGLDISHEFNISASEATSFTLANGNTNSITFDLAHQIEYSEGNAFIDGLLEYTPNGESREIHFSRSKTGSGFNAATNSPFSFEITKDLISNEVLPSHIQDPINIIRSNKTLDFFNGSSVKTGDIMSITLREPGSIDENSLNILVGTRILSRNSELDKNRHYFTFNPNTGVIQFYVNDTTGSVLLSCNDLNANALPDASITYLMSSEIKLTNPLFYPNPYIIGGGDLKLGFSITQPSTITVYIYNHLGQKVFTQDSYFADIGFNALTIDKNAEFIAPGIYVSRIVSKDADGNTSIKTAKLAIY